MEPDTDPVDGWGAVGLALALAGLALSLVTVLGADLLWLVAMGDDARELRSIPDDVGFAAADTAEWHPVLILAALGLSLIHEAGQAGLMVWHFLTALVGIACVVLDARRRGAGDVPTAVVLGVLVLGGLATFGVARLQTFSLVPFVVVLLLVRADERRPSRAIWWLVPMIMLWGNLHGSVLHGVAVLLSLIHI